MHQLQFKTERSSSNQVNIYKKWLGNAMLFLHMLHNAFAWCKTELFITTCAILQSKSIETKMDRVLTLHSVCIQ